MIVTFLGPKVQTRAGILPWTRKGDEPRSTSRFPNRPGARRTRRQADAGLEVAPGPDLAIRPKGEAQSPKSMRPSGLIPT
jgi:hypothetical protein